MAEIRFLVHIFTLRGVVEEVILAEAGVVDRLVVNILIIQQVEKSGLLVDRVPRRKVLAQIGALVDQRYMAVVVVVEILALAGAYLTHLSMAEDQSTGVAAEVVAVFHTWV
jgi:hypothetical protein